MAIGSCLKSLGPGKCATVKLSRGLQRWGAERLAVGRGNGSLLGAAKVIERLILRGEAEDIVQGVAGTFQ